MSTHKASLECRHISLAYGATPVLRDVNLTIEPGDFFALTGPARDGVGQRGVRPGGAAREP